MGRQPVQVHIYLYRQTPCGYEYAVFQRSDMPECWQGVCGGLEDFETLVAGARRELLEETGISQELPLYQLESISYLPAYAISANPLDIWGKEVIVIPMYFFAIPYDGNIQLSNEHITVEWLSYDRAYSRIKFEDQKHALYELNERLLRGLLH